MFWRVVKVVQVVFFSLMVVLFAACAYGLLYYAAKNQGVGIGKILGMFWSLIIVDLRVRTGSDLFGFFCAISMCVLGVFVFGSFLWGAVKSR